MKKFFVVFFALCAFVFGASKEPYFGQIGNGEAFVLILPDNKAKKLVIAGKERSWISHPSKAGYKFAIISAKYASSGQIEVLNGDEKLSINIKQLPYKKEQITVNQSRVTPPAKVAKRIKDERDEANRIYATFTPEIFISEPFEVPLKSKITSPYGGARMFNGSLKSYHSGTDFRAAVGVQIPASNDGIVRIAKDRYYAGGSVVIDHGSGIYTQYYHLSKVNVKVGERVSKGQIVGLSGATGRVSGPHLHFGVFAGGTQVNPMSFIKEFNEKLF